MTTKIAGMGEIDGAKRLVALAQKWKRSADAMLNVAQKELNAGPATMSESAEFAKAQVLASIQEVNDAEAYLAEVEKKWEVIDIDVDAPPTPGAPQKIMVHPREPADNQVDTGETANVIAASASSDGSQNNADSDDDVIVIDDSNDGTPHSSEGTTGGAAGAAAESSVKNESGSPSTGSEELRDDVPLHVTVKGSEIHGMNGAYTLIGTQNGAPKYSNTRFTIFLGTVTETLSWKSRQKQDVKKWFLVDAKSSHNPVLDACYYTARNDGTNALPPQKKWRPTNGDVKIHCKKEQDGITFYSGKGRRPAPELDVEPSQAEDFIDGRGETIDALVLWNCEERSINGTYEKRGYSAGVPAYYKTAADGIPSEKIYRDYHEGWVVSVHEGMGQWSERYRSGTNDLPTRTTSWTERYGSISTSLRVKLSGTSGTWHSKRRRVTGLDGM